MPVLFIFGLSAIDTNQRSHYGSSEATKMIHRHRTQRG